MRMAPPDNSTLRRETPVASFDLASSSTIFEAPQKSTPVSSYDLGSSDAATHLPTSLHTPGRVPFRLDCDSKDANIAIDHNAPCGTETGVALFSRLEEEPADVDSATTDLHGAHNAPHSVAPQSSSNVSTADSADVVHHRNSQLRTRSLVQTAVADSSVSPLRSYSLTSPASNPASARSSEGGSPLQKRVSFCLDQSGSSSREASPLGRPRGILKTPSDHIPSPVSDSKPHRRSLSSLQDDIPRHTADASAHFRSSSLSGREAPSPEMTSARRRSKGSGGQAAPDCSPLYQVLARRGFQSMEGSGCAAGASPPMEPLLQRRSTWSTSTENEAASPGVSPSRVRQRQRSKIEGKDAARIVADFMALCAQDDAKQLEAKCRDVGGSGAQSHVPSRSCSREGTPTREGNGSGRQSHMCQSPGSTSTEGAPTREDSLLARRGRQVAPLGSGTRNLTRGHSRDTLRVLVLSPKCAKQKGNQLL